MKILSIKFQNIHSLKGEHEIDFTSEVFTKNKLFVITGATGSGKSTLLDVICLALYNQTPRIKKVSHQEIFQLGGIITQGEKQAYAQVKYLCQKGQFTSSWSIRTKKTGTLDAVSMEVYGEGTGAISKSTKEVPCINEENLGLNYGQFVKSILLAQGDFALFLKANKSERSALLEQITSTEIYRSIGMSIYQKNKEQQDEIKSLKEKKNQLSGHILPEDLLKEHIFELQKQEKDKKETILGISTLKEKLIFCENLEKLEQKISELNTSLLQNQEETKEFNTIYGKKLENYKKIEPIVDKISLYETISAHLKEQEAFLKEKERELVLVKTQKQTILNHFKAIIGKESLSEEDLKEEIALFQQKLNDLETQRQQKITEFTHQLALLNTKMVSVDKQIDAKSDFLKEKESIEQEIQQNLEEILSLKALLFQNEEKETTLLKQKLLKEKDNIGKAQILAYQIKDLQKDFNQNNSKIEEISGLLEGLPQKIKQNKALLSNVEEHLNLLNEKKQLLETIKQLEDHRHSLKSGCPCPLCGALEHPYAENLPQKDNTLEVSIKEKENQKIQLYKTISQEENLLNLHSKTLQNLNLEKQQLSQSLKENQSQWEKDFKGYLISENFDLLEKEIAQKLHLLEVYEKKTEKIKILKEVLPYFSTLQQLILEGKDLRNAIFNLTKGDNVKENIKKHWNDWDLLSQNHLKLNNEIDITLKNKQQEELNHFNLEKEIQNFAKDHFFNSLEALFSAKIPFSEGKALQKKEQDLLLTQKSLQSKLEDTLKESKALKEERQIDQHKEEITQNIQILEQKLAKVEENWSSLHFKLTLHQQNEQELGILNEIILKKEKKNKHFSYLNQMIGDAKGERFNKFVQDMTLRQLLSVSNLQLEKLSTRYLLSLPHKEEDESLVVIDKEMGYKRRSVKTLSGGESFLLSLALALGLSSLASNNVTIESLFIDEGFGSLDSQTLDQTLDVLERLQQETSKTIGIISHIESLKERIISQIQISPQGSGYSTLKVVSLLD